MDYEPISICFNGVTYKRNPDSRQRAHRVYYAAPRGVHPASLHRAVWEYAHGRAVPAGCHIHHADGNPFNNEPSNLVALTPKEHAQEHAPEFHDARREWLDQIRPLASQWHGSDQGREWHRRHGVESWSGREAIERVCAACGARFDAFFGSRARFCSTACSRRVLDHGHAYERLVPCPVCGREFWQSKYRESPQTCGRDCGQRLRRMRDR